MPLPNIFKKASNFILGSENDSSGSVFHEGEVVFGKNNVCVHPPALLRQESDVVHHPGYLSVSCQFRSSPNKIRTLQLSWIPNSTLRKNPATIQRHQCTEERSESPSLNSAAYQCNRPVCQCTIEDHHSHTTYLSTYLEFSRRSSGAESGDFNYQIVGAESSTNESGTECDSQSRGETGELENHLEGQTTKLCLEQERQRSPSLVSDCSLPHSTLDDVPNWLSSPELLALQHNLTFPESARASPVIRKTNYCRRFSVDLSQMRSLRLFFNNSECTSGQLVVASCESQYKILHFHHGGLDHLAEVLNEWSFLLHAPKNTKLHDTVPYRLFMVCRPEVTEEELHPEEGQIGVVDLDVWIQVLNPLGQVEDDLTLRKGIFFGGLDSSLRSVIWPFLLHCFPFQSTYDEREQLQNIRRQEYRSITKKREQLMGDEFEDFQRNVQCIVERDVVRTDRANPYFAGADNPNIEVMKNILLNYAVYNSAAGYSQVMSDLLAPILAELKNEADAFWCFVGLMQRSSFVCTPTDGDMDRSLMYLRELIRIMLPKFYTHLEHHADAMELLFCHRWILLCFKREFPEPVALSIWEACWSNYLTDYFHLFVCLAILSVYADDVIAQDLHTDEMLLHFSSLAMFMDGQLILRKARGLLYHFRQMSHIPCTLAGLCRMCGPGIWDSSHTPSIECTSTTCLGSPCPYSAAQD